MARTCDWLTIPSVPESRCGKRAGVHHEAVYDHQRLTGDFCAQHDKLLAEALKPLGFVRDTLDPVAKAKTDWKERAAHIAASGTRFSAAEARAWLIEQGVLDNPRGRLSRAHIRMYADTH